MSDSLPLDMDCDVTEGEVPTCSNHKPAATNNNNTTETSSIVAKKTNDRKRQRRESLTTSPITIDLSDLIDKLINHNPIGQNRFGILGVLADIGIDSQEINNLHQNKMVPILRL